jgi:hypothetical protein
MNQAYATAEQICTRITKVLDNRNQSRAHGMTTEIINTGDGLFFDLFKGYPEGTVFRAVDQSGIRFKAELPQ